MRILHVVNRLSNLGNGIVNLAVDVAIEQRRAGHVVAVVSGSEAGYEPLLREAGVQLFSVDQERSPLNLLRAFVGFRRVLRAFKPDIVHAHMQTGLLLMLPWTKLFRVPLLAQLHNVHDRTASRMGWADRVVAVSAAVESNMVERGIPKCKLRTILNGTVHSPRVPDLSALTPAPLHLPAVLTVAGMSQRKGIADLLDAFEFVAAEFPRAHLYLVGEGPERQSFEQRASGLACSEQIHFEGFVSEPQRYMLACDVFVLASRRDSFGLVLAEAREAACAIVASDVDGIPEALDNGKAGILVPPQAPAALAVAIGTLLRDDDLRRQWQERAHSGIERFTVARMTNQLMEVYREITKDESSKNASLEHAAEGE